MELSLLPLFLTIFIICEVTFRNEHLNFLKDDFFYFFLRLQYNYIIYSFPFLSPNSPCSPLNSWPIFFISCCYKHAYIYICISLFVCMFSGSNIWYWRTSWSAPPTLLADYSPLCRREASWASPINSIMSTVSLTLKVLSVLFSTMIPEP